jgi:hypothetical protein
MDKDNEPIGELDDSAPIDRVLNLDEARLFRRKTVLAYIDGPIYDFGPTDITVGSPLPVEDDNGKIIGFGSVDIEKTLTGHRLIAEIAIDYNCEERLLVETGSEKRYARVHGAMKVPAMPVFDFQAKMPVMSLAIRGIQLSRLAPSDERLKPFGAPVI